MIGARRNRPAPALLARATSGARTWIEDPRDGRPAAAPAAHGGLHEELGEEEEERRAGRLNDKDAGGGADRDRGNSEGREREENGHEAEYPYVGDEPALRGLPSGSDAVWGPSSRNIQ